MLVSRIAVAALFLATLAACGGDDAEDALSEDEWVEQADEICSDADAELEDLAEEAGFGPEGDVPTAEDIAEFVLDSQIPAIEDQLDEIEELAAPEAIQDDVDALLDEARDALEALGEIADDDPELILAADPDDDPFAEVTLLAEELGLSSCGN